MKVFNYLLHLRLKVNYHWDIENETNINWEGNKKMKLFNKLAVATVGLVLGFSGIQGEANAASLEMKS